MNRDNYESNELCEICEANREIDYSSCTFDLYFINMHCIDLRINRKAREHKNVKPTITVF